MYFKDKIINIEKIENDSLFYDITVNKNHNFFANGILVHNCQNCFRNMEKHFDSVTWEEQEKVEGSSLTAYFYQGEFGICSRNLDLKRSEENTYWKTALSYDLETKMISLGKNIAIQAELVGPGIQGNIYGLTSHMLFVFDVFDIDTQSYYTPDDRRALTAQLGLTDAPVLRKNVNLSGQTCESMLKYADGKSVLGFTDTLREGLVYKANSPDRISFKAVSNLYLEKQK